MATTELHFSQYLNQEHINRIKNEFNFPTTLTIEQFIMDFELFYHIQAILPNCTVRGGMAVPFHLPDRRARRLSTDIDIVTGSSEESVNAAMQTIGKELQQHIEMPSIYKPKDPERNLPLSTYNIKYRSPTGALNPRIKVEITHSFSSAIPVLEVAAGFDLFSFQTDFPIVALDKSSLIGDKLTTLALKSIGVPPRRHGNIPKHIYDISSLLKVSNEMDIKSAVSVFETCCRHESACLQDGRSFTPLQVIDDIGSSLDSLLRTGNGYNMSNDQVQEYNTFKATLLANEYHPLTHINNILLTRMLTAYLQASARGKLTVNEVGTKLFADLQELDLLQGLDAEGKRKRKGEIIGYVMPDKGKELDFIRRLPAEQALMFARINNMLNLVE